MWSNAPSDPTPRSAAREPHDASDSLKFRTVDNGIDDPVIAYPRTTRSYACSNERCAAPQPAHDLRHDMAAAAR
jgi:hypothetical protein